jgi:hypothetical protein
VLKEKIKIERGRQIAPPVSIYPEVKHIVNRTVIPPKPISRHLHLS